MALTTEKLNNSDEQICDGDSAETIEKNPKSWAAWKREAERLRKVIDDMANREAQPAEIGRRSVFTCSSCGAQGLDEPLESRCHCMGDGAHWVESALYTAPPAPAVVNGRTAEGWMAEALLQKKIADDIRKSAPAVPDDVQHLKNVQELYHSQEERLFTLAQRIKGASFDKYSHTTAQAIDVLEREIFGDDGDACRAAMLAAAPEGGN